MIATRNNRGVAHENRAIEGLHRHWKHRLEQQLGVVPLGPLFEGAAEREASTVAEGEG